MTEEEKRRFRWLINSGKPFTKDEIDFLNTISFLRKERTAITADEGKKLNKLFVKYYEAKNA